MGEYSGLSVSEEVDIRLKKGENYGLALDAAMRRVIPDVVGEKPQEFDFDPFDFYDGPGG